MAQVSRPKAITRSAYLTGFYSGHVRRAATKSVSYRKVSRDKMERVIRSATRKRGTRGKEGSRDGRLSSLLNTCLRITPAANKWAHDVSDNFSGAVRLGRAKMESLFDVSLRFSIRARELYIEVDAWANERAHFLYGRLFACMPLSAHLHRRVRSRATVRSLI